jgi:hypothetical protein
MEGLAKGVRRAYRRLAVVPALLLAARYHQLRSNRSRAKERLLRATMIAPTCFKAHLRLGAIYLTEQDFYRAKREFLLARELDPGKFRRLYPLITGASGDININLFYFPGFTDEPGSPPANFLRDFIGDPLEEEKADKVCIGDFSSYREFRRFQEMGPFREEELAAIDWDEVERRFRIDVL